MLNTRYCRLKLLSYSYNNANFTIAFLSEKDNLFKVFKVHSVRHTSLTFTWVDLCERAEVKSEPTHFLNNGKAFPSLDDMVYSYQCLDQLQLLPRHWQAKRYWISSDLQKPNLLENNSNNIRSVMKPQIKNKKNRGISL